MLYASSKYARWQSSVIVIVAVKDFRTITHNMHIIARAMLIRVYTLMERPYCVV